MADPRPCSTCGALIPPNEAIRHERTHRDHRDLEQKVRNIEYQLRSLEQQVSRLGNR